MHHAKLNFKPLKQVHVILPGDIMLQEQWMIQGFSGPA